LVALAENNSTDHFKNSSKLMQKVFKQIEKERNENEYNRTLIEERLKQEKENNEFKFDMNETKRLRLVDINDSNSKQTSYINKLFQNNSKYI